MIRSPSGRGSESTTITTSQSTGGRTPQAMLPVCRTASLASTTLPATASRTQIGSGTEPIRSGTRNASTSASPTASTATSRPAAIRTGSGSSAGSSRATG